VQHQAGTARGWVWRGGVGPGQVKNWASCHHTSGTVASSKLLLRPSDVPPTAQDTARTRPAALKTCIRSKNNLLHAFTTNCPAAAHPLSQLSHSPTHRHTHSSTRPLPAALAHLFTSRSSGCPLARYSSASALMASREDRSHTCRGLGCSPVRAAQFKSDAGWASRQPAGVL